MRMSISGGITARRPGSAMQAASRGSPLAPRSAQVAAEAPAREGDSPWIDAGKREREVDDGVDHRLPVGAHGNALLDQELALPGSVEEEAVEAGAGDGDGAWRSTSR